jgi:hypothetical protein
MSIAHDKHKELIDELIVLIETTKTQVVAQANSSLTVLFWGIGYKILNHVLNNQRADYGKQIVVTLSRELVKKYGQNYEEKNLRRMIQFAEKYNDIEKVVTLSRHLSWSHFLVLIPIKDPNERDFYSQLAFEKVIGVRELRKQIGQKIYHRTENANLQILKSSSIEHNIFKDPYFLDFLGLKKTSTCLD